MRRMRPAPYGRAAAAAAAAARRALWAACQSAAGSRAAWLLAPGGAAAADLLICAGPPPRALTLTLFTLATCTVYSTPAAQRGCGEGALGGVGSQGVRVQRGIRDVLEGAGATPGVHAAPGTRRRSLHAGARTCPAPPSHPPPSRRKALTRLQAGDCQGVGLALLGVERARLRLAFLNDKVVKGWGAGVGKRGGKKNGRKWTARRGAVGR